MNPNQVPGRHATVQALMIALGALKKQNDHLLLTNRQLCEQNEKMATFCTGLSALADLVFKFKEEHDNHKHTTRHIGDSLIMLWGQLLDDETVDEVIQRERLRQVQNLLPPTPATPTQPTTPEQNADTADVEWRSPELDLQAPLESGISDWYSES
jgi:hypothetical protein